MKEFDLSKEREKVKEKLSKLVFRSLDVDIIMNLIEIQDKEFIKRLKENILNSEELSTITLGCIIDELAGDKLK